MIYVSLVVIVIVVVNLWLYLELIYNFARRTSIQAVPDLHHPPTDRHTAAPYRSAIAYERHRH